MSNVKKFRGYIDSISPKSMKSGGTAYILILKLQDNPEQLIMASSFEQFAEKVGLLNNLKAFAIILQTRIGSLQSHKKIFFSVRLRLGDLDLRSVLGLGCRE